MTESKEDADDVASPWGPWRMSVAEETALPAATLVLLAAQIMHPIIVPYDFGMNRLDAPDLLMFSPSPSTVLAGPPASPRAPAACLSSSMSRSTLSTAKGEVALKWLRMTEEGSSHMMTVEESVGVTLLRPLGPAPLDLITIFGQARKGKSFLLNKLASQTNLFPVQARYDLNESQPTTMRDPADIRLSSCRLRVFFLVCREVTCPARSAWTSRPRS